jgi:hypothetical protein
LEVGIQAHGLQMGGVVREKIGHHGGEGVVSTAIVVPPPGRLAVPAVAVGIFQRALAGGGGVLLVVVVVALAPGPVGCALDAEVVVGLPRQLAVAVAATAKSPSLSSHPVSAAVNAARAQGPQLIEPSPPEPTQPALFQ